MTLSEIRSQLKRGGYVVDRSTAQLILRASERGMLFWTKRRLTTSDESRLDLRPAKSNQNVITTKDRGAP